MEKAIYICANTGLRYNDASTSTDDLHVLEDKSANTDLMLILAQSPSEMLRDDNCQTQFCTGLQSYHQFQVLLNLFIHSNLPRFSFSVRNLLTSASLVALRTKTSWNDVFVRRATSEVAGNKRETTPILLLGEDSKVGGKYIWPCIRFDYDWLLLIITDREDALQQPHEMMLL